MDDYPVLLGDAEDELESIDLELGVIQMEMESLEEKRQRLLERRRKITQEKKDQEERRISQSLQQRLSRDWERGTFKWSQRATDMLRSVFNLHSFRPLQLSCINASMSGNDVILIMPTGGGKSLCYQLPAVLSQGFTLVITPLISLMEDQILAAKKYGIIAHMLTGNSSKADVKVVHDAMLDHNTPMCLLYLSPEKIAKNKSLMSKLEKAHERGNLARIVIDEVHCASQWGHDFRPDYKILGILKRQFKGVPILGLTATATSRVLQDVQQILNVPSALVFKSSYNRPNLHYQVRKKPASRKGQIEELAKVIKEEFHQQCGIVYTLSRKDSEQVADDLKVHGVKAGCYHADMSAEHRTQIHHKWLSGIVQVVVATIAFGMGIDKPNVRFVIHHTLSKSVENYYQESGRAGRDGEKAHCIIFYRPFDTFRLSVMSFQERTGLRNLYSMIRYCHGNGECRRMLLATHFGDTWRQSDCDKMCDVCTARGWSPSALAVRGKEATDSASSSMAMVDITDLLVSLLDTLEKSSKAKMTALQLSEAWNKTGGPKEFDHFSSDTIDFAIVQALLEDVLQEDFHFTSYNTVSYIQRGPGANAVRSGFRRVMLPNPEVLQLMRKRAQKAQRPRVAGWVSTRGESSRDSPAVCDPSTLSSPTVTHSLPGVTSVAATTPNLVATPTNLTTRPKLVPTPNFATTPTLTTTPSLTATSKLATMPNPVTTPNLPTMPILTATPTAASVHGSASTVLSRKRESSAQVVSSHGNASDYSDGDFDFSVLKNLRGKRKKSEEVLCTSTSLSQSDLQDDLVILSDSD